MRSVYVSNKNEPKYVYLYKEENAIITNDKFDKFWKTDLVKPRFEHLRETKISLFNYHPVSLENIDMAVYSLNNTPNKFKNTTVDFFPDLLRKASHKFPLFPRLDDRGNSGFYDFLEDNYLLENLKFVDLGNISISNDLDQLYLIVENISKKDLKFLTIGGDHAITFYNLNAINKIGNKRPILIQLDAHQDVGKHELNNEKLHQGNFISHLLENNIVTHVIQVGIRGIRSRNQVINSEKITVLNSLEWDKLNAGFIKNILDYYDNYDIYLSIDMDVLDPSEFAFVDFPVKLGLRTDQLISILKRIFGSKANIIGADIVEVNANGNIDNNDYDLVIYILIHLMNQFTIQKE